MTNVTTLVSNFTSHNYFVQILSRSEEFILPCLLLIGTTCNTLTFIVMRRGRMRHSSSCFYMATLAIADTFVLWIGCFNRWLELIDKQRPILACNMCCKLGTFAFFFFADCSVWITVAMTFERYIAVSQPLRASQICTIKRARYTLLLLLFIFFLINVHFLWTFHLTTNEHHCIPVNSQSLFLKYFTWFDSFKYSFCPFTVLITLNILIIKSLLDSRNTNNSERQNQQSTFIKTAKYSSCQYVLRKPSAYRRANRRLTTMLLTVSFAFCIFSMPISIMQLIDVIYSDIEQRSPKLILYITIGKIIAEISQYINHSSNFFLYAFTGRVFRHELGRLFTCSEYRFFSSSSQRLRHRAKKFMSFHNPTQGLHEQFYSNGKYHTRIIIAPKNEFYRSRIDRNYSSSQSALTKQNSQYENETYFTSYRHSSIDMRQSLLTQIPTPVFNKERQSLLSFIENINHDQTTPLIHSSSIQENIKPYGLTDLTLNS